MRTALGRRLWDVPRLLTDEEQEGERKASWLELFFDLVFVAVIAEITHLLATDLTWEGLGKYIMLFIPALWCWIGSTMYNDRFERDDVSHRISTFALMVPVLGMAVSAHDAFGETANAFAASYVTFRVVLIIMWWRAGQHNPILRPVTDRYLIGYGTSAALWTGSIFVDQPQMFYLWGAGLIIDLVTPFTIYKYQLRLPRLNISHITERYGLFIILVLGESVIALVAGASALHGVTFSVMVTCTLGLVLAFGMWWLYFGHISHARKDNLPLHYAVYGWMHLPLIISLGAMGAATLNVVAHGTHDVPDEALSLACGALATALVSMGIIRMAIEGPPLYRSIGVLFIGAAVALAIAYTAQYVDAFMLLSMLCLLVYLLIIHRIWNDNKYMVAQEATA